MPNSQPKPIDDPSILFTSEIDQSIASATALYDIKVYILIVFILFIFLNRKIISIITITFPVQN